MNKNEYLQSNLEAVLSLNIKPFKNIDTVEKGLFNYQYYNALAKESKIVAYNSFDRETQIEKNKEADYYYYKKDISTLVLLKLMDYVDVTAYFIKVRSKYLKGQLFEIVLNSYGMILHSTNKKILNNLRDEGVFDENIKQSLIDNYINQKY